MAEKRMFAKTIIDSDLFLDMPASTQLLYFHLAMRADDDGFVNSPKKIQRMIGCSDDDIKILISKQFIIPFESGIVVIKHWKIHNYIRKDTYNETRYLEEKKHLVIDEDKAYQFITDSESIRTVDEPSTERIPTVDTDKIRLDKISLDKINNMSGKPDSANPNNAEEYQKIISYLNQKAGTNYRASTAKTKQFIHARLAEGFKTEDFFAVIDKKCAEWLGTDMEKFLRPETLFGDKFEGYLNQRIMKRSEKNGDEQAKNNRILDAAFADDEFV